MKRMMFLKRTLMFLILSIVLTALSGCGTSYENTTVFVDPLTQNDYVGETLYPGIQSIIEDDENYTLSAFYPATGDPFIDQMLTQYVNAQIELYKQEVSALGSSHRNEWPYELKLTYTVARDDANYYAVLFKESKYLGAALPSEDIITFNFDKEAETLLSLEDLFSDDTYLNVLSHLTYDVIKNEDLVPATVDVNWIKGGLLPNIDNFKHFLLLPDGLKFIFDLYQLGPAYLGTPSVELPYDMLAAHIVLNVAHASTFLESYAETTGITDDASAYNGGEVVSDDMNATRTGYEPITPSIPSDNAPRVAITFENGPHPIYTPIILDALRQRNVPAAFFCLGNRAEDYPALCVRIVQEGHILGNGTFTHPQLTRLSDDERFIEFGKTQEKLEAITGETPMLFRPPYGLFDEALLKQIDLPFILWSVDPQDRIYQDPDYIVTYVSDHVFDGAIIRLHDNYASTAQSVGRLIDVLLESGYTIVPVDQLLNLSPDSTGVYSQAVR
jgi:peptidoglycan/xylan/chitin deacetylase (PgdA/CDA1 family)